MRRNLILNFFLPLFVVSFAFCVAASTSASASDPLHETYTPVFSVERMSGAGVLFSAYVYASKSPTREVAVSRWKTFLEAFESNERTKDSPLVRQARLELLRLLYLAGRQADGDEILKKFISPISDSTPSTPAGAGR
jgi:hypothetical protein